MATGRYLDDAALSAILLSALDGTNDLFPVWDDSAGEIKRVVASQILNRLTSTADISHLSALANLAAVDSANDKFLVWDADATAFKTLTATEILDRILTTADISALSSMTTVEGVDPANDRFLLWDNSATAFVALTASQVVAKLWQGPKVNITTTPQTIAATASGTLYHNTTAVTAITVNLPAATAGTRFSFARVAAYDIVLDGNGTETINGNLTYRMTANGRVDIECFANGSWVITNTTDAPLPRTVNVLQYGAVGDGTTDDSAAIQAAITAAGTGGVVIFPPTAGAAGYKANNLTVSSNRQTWIGFGLTSEIIKGANGDLLTVSGDYFTANNMHWRGESATPSYTGNNVVVSGASPTFRDCSSRWAYARALKCTGNAVHVCGTGGGGIWQTATGSGYDIEIGVSGTATLYHTLTGIYTSQSTGGILFIDTGSSVLSDSQFGKLTIDSGTSPSGVNGGVTIGCRILGDVTVELSNAIFVANQFGSSIAITFAAGTSGHRLDETNNVGTGVTVTNNGNDNSIIRCSTSSGSVQQVRYGDSSAVALLDVDATGDFRFRASSVTLNNNKSLRFYNAADASPIGTINVNGSDRMLVTNTGGGITVEAGGTNTVTLANNGATRLAVDSAGRVRIGDTSSPMIASGSGTPEAAVTAPVGSLFLRTDGGAGTSLYVKESGSGNTGWVAK